MEMTGWLSGQVFFQTVDQDEAQQINAFLAARGIAIEVVADLAIGLTNGSVLDPHSHEFEAALDKILAAAKKANKITGLYCANAERALSAAKRGFRFLAVGSDLGFLRAGIAEQMNALKK